MFYESINGEFVLSNVLFLMARGHAVNVSER